MSNDTQKAEPEQPPQRPTVMMPRLGNVQALIEMRGEGHFRQPYVRFNKLAPKSQPAELHNLWSIEDVAVLHQLTGNILTDMYKAQTLLIPGGAHVPVPDPEEAIERETK